MLEIFNEVNVEVIMKVLMFRFLIISKITIKIILFFFVS